jgi:dihydroorotate dehydrogenase
MYSLIRPLLFKVNPEIAHHLALTTLKYAPKCCFRSPMNQPVHAMGLTFPHPIGLAAGLDKDAAFVDGLAKIGFSFIEVGTVTPLAQAGNPKPRLFRLPKHQALINRMGFNNHGVDNLVDEVKRANYSGILGINIGKNKDTPIENAVSDYLVCFRKVYPLASYVTINVSSPNTPDLRQLQQGSYFFNLLQTLKEEQKRLEDESGRHVPLVVKVSPDEESETLKQMMHTMLELKVEGIIATNTTAKTSLIPGLSDEMKQGGLSGKPVMDLSNSCLRLIKHYVGNEITLIGVGGVDDVSCAQEKLDAGASLIQVYTGLIYQGPGLIHRLANNITAQQS